MSGPARRVKRARDPLLTGFALRKKIAHVRKEAGLGGFATTLAQIAIERRLFGRKPTARTRNGRRARG